MKHVLQQHYPQYHDAALKSAIVKQTRHAQQRKLLELYDYHACANAERAALGAKADQEQQLWSECSRLLANCIIYYNACILSELLERAERRQDYQRADAIKRANPASWKHVNLYGAYSFLDIGDGVDLQELVNLLEAARGRGASEHAIALRQIDSFAELNRNGGAR